MCLCKVFRIEEEIKHYPTLESVRLEILNNNKMLTVYRVMNKTNIEGEDVYESVWTYDNIIYNDKESEKQGKYARPYIRLGEIGTRVPKLLYSSFSGEYISGFHSLVYLLDCQIYKRDMELLLPEYNILKALALDIEYIGYQSQYKYITVVSKHIKLIEEVPAN